MAADYTFCTSTRQGETYSAKLYRPRMADKLNQILPNLAEPHQRLKWARVRTKSIDATEAARRHHWTVSTYLSHENGNRPLSRAAAIRYGNAFKVPAGWLLYNEGVGAGSLDPVLAEIWEHIKPEKRPTAIKILKALVDDEDVAA